MKAFQKTTTWILLVLIFGLMQLWIDIGVRHYHSDNPIRAFELAKDGALLFFVMGTTYGIAIDYHLDGKSQSPSLLKNLFFVFVPTIIMVFVVFAYLLSRGSMDARQEEFFMTLNWLCVVIAAFYAAISKFFMFY